MEFKEFKQLIQDQFGAMTGRDEDDTIRDIIKAKKHSELADKSIGELEAMLSK